MPEMTFEGSTIWKSGTECDLIVRCKLQVTLVLRVSRQFTRRIFRRGTNVPPAYFFNRILRIALFSEVVREVRRRFHSTANPPSNSSNSGQLEQIIEFDAYFSCFEELFGQFPKTITSSFLLP